jgi:hypothetical protein
MGHANARMKIFGRRPLVERLLAAHRPADVPHADHPKDCIPAAALRQLAPGDTRVNERAPQLA